jgi:hypothetical protein
LEAFGNVQNLLEGFCKTPFFSDKGFQGQFWIDGIVSKSLWGWSDQTITWDVFDADQRAVIGNGSNYKLVYNSNQSIQYQIADDIDQNKLYFICEYQGLLFIFLN